MKKRYVTSISMDSDDFKQTKILQAMRYKIIDIYRAGIKSLILKHQTKDGYTGKEGGE